MLGIHLPYINLSLDVFALLVTIIILITCASEFTKNKSGAKYFLIFQLSVVLALIADIVACISEGNPELANVTMISNTIKACEYRFAIVGFMGYLISSLYERTPVIKCLEILFQALCAFSIVFSIGNVFFEYVYHVSETGHYEHTGRFDMGVMYLLYPILSIVLIVLLAYLAERPKIMNRTAFVVYTMFPALGFVLDYTIHGFSLTGVGFAISILVIYTSIYRVRRKELETQKSALMLSQINPHFVYNTLSTIVAMCEVSPPQAKGLTLDFAQYLRKNIDSLNSEDMIPFDQEMEHVSCYLKIEKARFMERLNVMYSIRCKDFDIPPLTIQPLVENAIKHGITKKVEGGTLKISTYAENKNYIIEIIDDGIGFDTELSELHVGIKNVRTRLATMCKGKLTVKSMVGVGTRVRIELPMKKGKKK